MTVPTAPVDADQAGPARPEQPYPGLRPFTSAEWSLFFGRESMTQDVVSRLVEKQFVAVHGDSGCGKSSLIAAGVMPFLEHDQARAGGTWFTAIMRPEDNPLGNLARALAGAGGEASASRALDIRRLLNRGTDAPAAVAKYLGCDEGRNVCILFDQFEELFEHARRGGGTEAGIITDFLVGLTRHKPKGLHAVLTMRSDYLGQCAQYRGFAETVNETQYLVPRMERPALMRAIREPAALFGGVVDMDLAAKLIADAGVGQDQLPLIQHGLMLMWRRKTAHGSAGVLTLDDYRAEGDLDDQLSRHADTVMAEAITGPEEEPTVEALFRALTDRNPEGLAIRRRQRFGDLVAVTGAPRDVLARIVSRFRAPDASFLRPYGTAPIEDEDVIDVSHEAFIRNWRRISESGTGWLDREADDGLIWTSLKIAAATFEKNPDALLSPAAAEERAAWMEEHNAVWAERYKGGWDDVAKLVSESRAAIQLARESRAARRRRIVVGGLSALSLVFFGLAAFATWQTIKARQLADESRQLATVARAESQEAARQKAEADRQRQIAEQQSAEAQQQRAEAERQRQEAERQSAEAQEQRAEADRQRQEAEKQEQLADAKAMEAMQSAEDAARKTLEAMTNETASIAAVSGVAFFESGPVEGVKLAIAAWPRVGDASRPTLPQTLTSLGRALADLRERQRFRHSGSVFWAVYSPDGKRVATASNDRIVRIWDAATGAMLTELKGHENSVFSVEFSPDGARIVTASGDKTARVWDAVTGTELVSFKNHELDINYAEFSPDGRRIASGSNDKTIRIWDSATGHEISVLRGHEDAVVSVRFSRDGTKLVSASWDKSARVWDAATGAQQMVLTGHEDKVYSAMFSSDGKRILTGSRDKTARIWDATSGLQLSSLNGHDSAVNWAAFSPDGERVATASWDKTVRVWDSRSGSQMMIVKGHSESVWSVMFSPDGRRIVTSSADKTSRIWDVSVGLQVQSLLGPTDEVASVAYSPDGSKIIAASADATTSIWDAATGNRITVLKGHEGTVHSAFYSSDGKRILTSSHDKTARIWDAETGSLVMTLSGHGGPIWSAVFSRDGRLVATASGDKTARIWDATTGMQVIALSGHTDQVTAVAFSADGSRLLTGSVDGTGRVWDVGSGQQILQLDGHTDTVNSASFSPDGRRIVTSSWDKTARIWDAETGKRILTLAGHEDSVWTAAFSPDGSRILTAASPSSSKETAGDKTVRIWDAATGVALTVINGLVTTVNAAAFSPDGKHVIIASDDKTVSVWDISSLETGNAFEIACQRLGNNTDLGDVAARYSLSALVPICGENAPLVANPMVVDQPQ